VLLTLPTFSMHRITRPFAARLALGLGAVLLGATSSHAADPTTADCLAASEATIKLRSEHKLRAAREQLLICSSPACPADIRKECSSRVDAVSSQIPTILFEAKDGSGNDLAGVTVTMDGAPLAQRLEGTALSLDPGEHTFRFEATGQTPVDRVLVIEEGQKDRRERVVFVAPAPLEGVKAPPTDVTAEVQAHPITPQRIAAIASGGVGVLGGILGTAFGVSASSKWSGAQSECGKSCAPTNPAVGERSSAVTDATLSTVFFVTAGVGLATGAILWFTAPREKPRAPPLGIAPDVGPGHGGVVVAGRF
jgi:hypothetical protein